ncbi:MAG TPA: hypothetical protein PLA94_25775, partial [Myxococcota bacterium]|nr:hypothetical protein [Myxococcota bacterium]
SLSFNPGNQTLTATLGDGRKATVQGGEGKTVFDSLPAEMWERLKAKKTVAVRVRVEPLGGNRLKIAALERAA